MKKFIWLFIGLFCGCLIACRPEYVYEKEQKIPNNGVWAYADTLNFNFTITDTTARYNFYLDIEHSDTFAFQNIYLQLHTRFPGGRRLNRVRSLDFFDAQGTTIGNCSGNYCTLQTLLQENAFFRETGEYVVTIAQYSRQEQLPGIRSMTLALKKIAVQK